MKKNISTWTMIDIVKGKTLPFIILTILFTKIMNDVANKGLNYYLNSFNDHLLYTYQYSFGKYGLILVIPAAFVSIWIIKIFLMLRKVPANTSVDGAEATKMEKKLSQERKFKWYSLYGFVLGYFLYAYVWIHLMDYFSKTITNDYAQTGFLLIGTFGGIVAIFYLAGYINKLMIKVTYTNKELLYDIERGMYDAEFVQRSMKKDDIVTALERGWATTFKGATIYLSVRKWLLRTGKFAILIVTTVFKVLFIIAASISSFLSSGINRSSSNPSDSEYARAKEEAFRNTQQKKEERDYAAKKLAKQLNYNPRYAGSEVREFKNKQKEYKEAEIERRKYY